MDEAGRAYEAELQAYERKRIAAAGMPGIFPGAVQPGAPVDTSNVMYRPSPTATIGLNTPVQSASHRIAELAKQVTESGHMLAEARAQHRNASISREKCEMQFAQVTDALMQAIHEHREGTPEGVPYQAEGMR